MGERFPHVRLYGDTTLAERHLRQAHIELSRTKRLAEEMGVHTFSRRVFLSENSFIYIVVNKYGDYITIQAEPPEEAPEKILEEEPVEFLTLYSGFAYKNWLVYDPSGDTLEEQYPTLQDFHPTRRTFNAYRRDFPLGWGVYQANERLNVRPSDTLFRWNFADPSFSPFASFGPPLDDAPNPDDDLSGQTQRIRPCAFSGALQIAASLAISHGDMRVARAGLLQFMDTGTSSQRYRDIVEIQGFQCEYEQRHERTHGIVKRGSSSWLVEVSEQNGIIARRLPILVPDLFRGLNNEEQQIINDLGGVPTGEAFPTSRDEVLEGIDAGWILELQPPEYLEEYYNDYTAYQQFNDYAYSWCFNPEGSEARTTTWGVLFPEEPLGNNAFTSAYWKIEFETDPAQPFSAALSLISEDPMIQGARSNMEAATLGTGTSFPNSASNITIPPVQFPAINPGSPYSVSIGVGPTAEHVDIWESIPEKMDAVVWVGWINGDWSEIHYRSDRIVANARTLSVPHVTNIDEAYEIVDMVGANVVYYDFNDDDPGHPIEGYDWYQLAPSPWSTQLNFEEKPWIDYRPYRYTRLLEAEVHNEEDIIYQGPSYSFIYFSFWAVHNPHFLELPTAATQFFLAPYNRNAYFCIDRSNTPASTQLGNMDRVGDTIMSASNVLHRASSFNLAPDDVEHLELGELAPEYGPYGIFAAKSHSFINHAVDTTIWDASDSAICTSLPTPPYHVYSGTRTLVPTGSDSPGHFGGKFTTNYEVLDGGDWWEGTTTLCDPVSFPPLAPTILSSRENFGSTAFGIDLPDPPPFQGAITVWLVADRLPEGPAKKVLELENATLDQLIYIENGTDRQHHNLWCQTAVVGDEAAIHTDLSELEPGVTYISGLDHLKNWKYTTVGTHPPLPDYSDDSYQLTRLTFVGINGP